MKRRILSIITALALCLSLCPTWAFAAETDPALCRHHPAHTGECGYIAPTEGQPCGHEHTEDCYTADEAGGEVLDCKHSHDNECGYVQADPGTPCGYECHICPIETLIAALPGEVMPENADEVRARLDEILALFSELTGDEQEQIDLFHVYELQGALDGANDPGPVEGEVSVDYQEATWDGSTVTYIPHAGQSCNPVTDSATAVTWNAGWYAVSDTVTIAEPITVSGEVHLILTDGCVLNAAQGIVVTKNNSLTIYAQSGGTGTLNATGTTDSSNNASAGIGGSTTEFDSGRITIHGGVINVTGGSSGQRGCGGAGIGGGTSASENGGNSGTITIYGGTVTANSGTGNLTGAGIGGGGSNSGTDGAVAGDGSGIIIYGGDVTATSKGTVIGGAGIGGGGAIKNGGAGSNIQIFGGRVTATGGKYAAGIGGGSGSETGSGGDPTKSGDGAVTISGGIVTAVGSDYAAGIGGGGGYEYTLLLGSLPTTYTLTGGTGTVTITGGIVDASSPTDVGYADYKGAPIGNGGNQSTAATVNKENAIVFENGVGTVCGNVTFNSSYAVPAGYSLHIPAGNSLSGSGTLSGGGRFTAELSEDMISVPTNLYYDGTDRTEYLTTELSAPLNEGIMFCGQKFTVSGWAVAISRTDDLHYTATYTNTDNSNTFQKTITLQQSGTTLDGAVGTYKDGVVCSDFTASDTITVKATPTPTGEAPTKAAARLRADPLAGQMVVYVGETQVSVPADAVDGTYTMTISAADVLLAAGGPGTEITLIAKFVGNDNMADGAGKVDVNITAAAKIEKNNQITGYVGESGLDAAFAEDSGNSGAIFTLLANVTRAKVLTIKIDCDLDLGGHTITCTGNTAVGTLGSKNVTIRGTGEIISTNGTALDVWGNVTLAGGCFRNTGSDAAVSISYQGSLSVTDGNVTIQNTGGGYGLAVKNAQSQSVQLSAGKYSGTAGAISIVDGSLTLGDLLGHTGDTRYAYFDENGTTPLTGKLEEKLLAETVTVQECKHTGDGVCEYTHTPGTTIHQQTCRACGKKWGEENCSFGENGKCACEAVLAVTLPADLNLTYNGAAQEPGVTVTVDGQTLATEKYQLSYDNNINAGDTAKVTVTAAGSSFSGSVSTTFTIQKAALTIKANDQTITYGESITEGTDQVTAANLCTGDTLKGITLDASTKNVPGGIITPSAAQIQNGSSADATANYSITYEPGTLTIDKANVSLTTVPAANTLTYNGTAQALVSAGTASVGDVVYSLTETGSYTKTIPTGTNAGNYEVWYKVEGTSNYNGIDPVKVTVTIAQAAPPAPQTGTLNVRNGHTVSYPYDLSRLLPTLASGQSFGGDVTYTLKAVNITEAGYYDSSDPAAISGTTLTLPVKAVTSDTEGRIGTITVTISYKNFADVDATINVNRVNKQPVTIVGVTAQNGTYDGSTHNGYTGTPTASPYSGDFVVTYAKADGTALSGAPTDAGDYTVTFTLDESNDYTGSRTLSFTISKASITITADDKRADVGTAKPALTYTVTGLVGADTLATAPTLTCDADMDTIGQYPITASGAAVPATGNYNTAITYVAGTLAVTDPTIAVTGVTLNKTSMTLTVGGSERLTATVAPSDATDKTVTWASSNTAVATVDASGNITAVSVGTATITVTTADGGKTAACTVTVRSNSGGGYVPTGPSTPGSSTLPVTTTGQGSSTVTTTTTAAPAASTQGGRATATVDTAMGQEIVKQAVANRSETVVIAPKVTGSVTKTEVSIPASTVGQIGSQTNASLTVSTPVADVTIPNGGLGSLSSAGGTIIVTAEQTGNTVELSVTVGGRTVQSVPGGVTLTIPMGNTTPGTVAVLVHPNGTQEVVRKSVAGGGAVTIPLDGSAKLVIVDNSGYFADVPATSWAADAVAFASAHELFNGTAPGRFSPNQPMSRGMLAVVLHNLENNPAQALTGAFADVDNSQWYAEGVSWAAARGIIGGYGNGTFGPNDNITREQLAVMLWRYAGSPAATERELHFADAYKASDWAQEALRWAVEKGVLNGKGGGILDPGGEATRAETAQMLKNFMEKQ